MRERSTMSEKSARFEAPVSLFWAMEHHAPERAGRMTVSRQKETPIPNMHHRLSLCSVRTNPHFRLMPRAASEVRLGGALPSHMSPKHLEVAFRRETNAMFAILPGRGRSIRSVVGRPIAIDFADITQTGQSRRARNAIRTGFCGYRPHDDESRDMQKRPPGAPRAPASAHRGGRGEKWGRWMRAPIPRERLTRKNYSPKFFWTYRNLKMTVRCGRNRGALTSLN
jgi:hypothetical protein